MSIRVQTEFIRGATVRLIYYHYDDAGDLAYASGVVVSVIDPDGTKVVDNQTMNPTAIGTYEYYYTTDSDVDEGDYQVEVIATDGSYKTYANGHFNLTAGINE